MTVRRLTLVLLCSAVLATSQPVSDLFQTGIFAQEVTGDLDEAIRIYRQILNAGPGMRLYAPQAQYRLGLCLLRKKDLDGARAAFQALMQNYPQEQELIARAREHMPLPGGLLPAPWGSTEVSEYRWTIPGVSDGWSISRIGVSAADKRTLRVQTNFYGPQLNAAMVDVDRTTMRPGPATYRGPSAASPRTEGGDVYRMPAPDEYPSSVWSIGITTSGDHEVYAQAELLYLLRRMPLESGKSATLWLLAPGTTGFAAVKATVAGTERITVPAGTFDCHKVRLTADPTAGVPAPAFSTVSIQRPWPAEGETLWYGQSGARPLVRIALGAARGELTSLSTGDPQGTRSYHDISAGFSFTLPPGWIYHARNAIGKEGSSVDLIDPESQTVVIIAGRSKETDPAEIDADLEKGAETRMAGVPHRDTSGRIGGHRALTRVGGRDAHTGRISWITWVQSEATRVSIAFQTEEVAFDGVLQRLQPILDSFRMP